MSEKEEVAVTRGQTFLIQGQSNWHCKTCNQLLASHSFDTMIGRMLRTRSFFASVTPCLRVRVIADDFASKRSG